MRVLLECSVYCGSHSPITSSLHRQKDWFQLLNDWTWKFFDEILAGNLCMPFVGSWTYLELVNECLRFVRQVNRWLSVRLEIMGIFIILGTAIIVTIFPTNAGLAGLALTAALNLTGKIFSSFTINFPSNLCFWAYSSCIKTFPRSCNSLARSWHVKNGLGGFSSLDIL